MGKFERAYRKKFKQQAPPFGEWSDEHGDRLPQIAPQDAAQGAVCAKRRLPAWIWVAAGGVLLLLALTSAYLLHNRSQTGEISDLTFGEESVITKLLEEGDMQRCESVIPTLSQILPSQPPTKTVLIKDDSLVMINIAGTLSATDYYFINARMVFNRYFLLADIEQYNDLDNQIRINGIDISYGAKGTDLNGFDEYYVVSEHKDATVYWTVSSMFGQFDEWLQLTFAA